MIDLLIQFGNFVGDNASETARQYLEFYEQVSLAGFWLGIGCLVAGFLFLVFERYHDDNNGEDPILVFAFIGGLVLLVLAAIFIPYNTYHLMRVKYEPNVLVAERVEQSLHGIID